MQCTLPPRCTLNPTGKSMCWAVQTMGCSTSFRFPTLCMSHSLFSVNWRLRFDSICTFTLQTTDTHTHSPFRYNYRSSASPTTSPSPVPTTSPSAFPTNQPAVSPTTSPTVHRFTLPPLPTPEPIIGPTVTVETAPRCPTSSELPYIPLRIKTFIV